MRTAVLVGFLWVATLLWAPVVNAQATATAAVAPVPTTVVPAATTAPATAAAVQRIVFLGDSTTDNNTYPLLVLQALKEAKKPLPVMINSGIGGDVAASIVARLGRDALAHKPTLVCLSIGVNDMLRDEPPEGYEKSVSAIAERLKQENVPLMILGTTTLKAASADANKKLEAYNAVLLKVATKNGLKYVATYESLMTTAATGKVLHEADGVHLSYEGNQILARALLDALGHGDVALPAEFKVEPAPGLITQWKMSVATAALDEKSAGALKDDGNWKALTLPEQDKNDNWWLDQERKRGFALSLGRLIGPGNGYVGMATIESTEARKVFFNTGAHLQTIWLNGQQIYKTDGSPAWHAGKDRVGATLKAGANTVIIETKAGGFFLSVTDDNDWS